MSLLKTDAPNLFRDPDTGAVINTNIGDYHRIVESRRLASENEALASKVDALDDQLTEIKTMLAQALLALSTTS